MLFALFALVFCSLCRAELLEGYFTLPAAESDGDKDYVLLDPTAKAAVFEHEGDMTFIKVPGEEKNSRHKRNAVLSTIYLWPGGEIPYYIQSNFDASERRIIYQAMKHWEDHTCIRFRPRVQQDRNRIVIFRGGAGICASFVGRQYYSRAQGVSLGSGCVDFSTVVHELGHAIGFYHEHNRPDRDDYINIDLSGYSGSLVSQLLKQQVANTLGLGYDYASIMHYSSLGGVISSKGNVPFGNAEELSPLDIAKAIRLYNHTCGPKESWPPPSTVVPASLSLPRGTSCGWIITTNQNGSFQFPGHPTHPRNGNCTVVIEAPRGYALVFSFSNLQLGYSRFCFDEYVQFLYGSSLSGRNVIRFSRSSYVGGRICGSTGSLFRIVHNVITVNYHTDNSNAQSLIVNYELRDINECSSDLCHQCTNLIGSFNCSCNEGYYSSQASKTCYDINECAFNNGGCKEKCLNSAGSYTCACEDGEHLQTDGVSCGVEPDITPTAPPPTTPTTPPPTTPAAPPPTTPAAPPPTTPTAPPPTTPTAPPTTTPTTPPPTTPTAPPPTTPTTPPPTTPTTPTTSDITTSPQICALHVLPDVSATESTCSRLINPGTLFGPPEFPENLKTAVQSCWYILNGQSSQNYQLRIRYLDFPATSNCSDVSLTVYEGFSSHGPIIKKMCGGESYCEEVTIPAGRRLVIFQNKNLSGSFRGFAASYELVPDNA